MQSYKFSGLILPLMMIICLKGLSQATDQEKSESLKTIIGNKDFRFLPQSATTMKGNTSQLDPGYELKLMADSISVDLPFFEEGYSVAFGSNDDKVKFNSKQFTYSAEATKKGGWNITIIPKKDPKINKIYLNILPTGYGTLRLYISSKEPMSYYGAIGDNISK